MVDELLEERGEIYGGFDVNVEGVAEIMGALSHIHKAKTGKTLNLIDFSHLNYQVIKLVRLAATPSHLDSWKDIQGYAKLSEGYYG